jgi:microcystin-dependent protein
MFGGSFAPAGWMFCDGTPLAISENDVLFQLIGTTYGGDGQETFNLPDLRGRVPIHNGTAKSNTTYTEGEMAGVESVTLNTNQIPAHSHPLLGTTTTATDANASGNLLAQASLFFPYINVGPSIPMAPSVGPIGGSQPHENLQPYSCINFIISLFGVFPSQT